MITLFDFAKFLALSLFILLICSFGLVLSSDKSTDTALKEATKQTMYKSINMGCLRVDEAITIDENQAKKVFPEKYETLTNFEDGETDLYIHTMNGVSPMMATEAYQTFESPIDKALKSLNPNNDSKGKTRTWENYIGIFEATNINKPPSAEYKGYTQDGNKVDDFQCN